MCMFWLDGPLGQREKGGVQPYLNFWGRKEKDAHWNGKERKGKDRKEKKRKGRDFYVYICRQLPNLLSTAQDIWYDRIG